MLPSNVIDIFICASILCDVGETIKSLKHVFLKTCPWSDVNGWNNMYMFPFWVLAHCTVIVQIIYSFLSKYLHIVEVLVIIAKSSMNIYLKVYLWISSFLFLLEKYQDWEWSSYSISMINFIKLLWVPSRSFLSSFLLHIASEIWTQVLRFALLSCLAGPIVIFWCLLVRLTKFFLI